MILERRLLIALPVKLKAMVKANPRRRTRKLPRNGYFFSAVLLFSFYFLSYTLRLTNCMFMNNQLPANIFTHVSHVSLSTICISTIYDLLPLLRSHEASPENCLVMVLSWSWCYKKNLIAAMNAGCMLNMHERV